eukprot:TRINITY_DN25787_c0_g1_i2.p1 TRINITY_DN25787_c0_g1~~TRINITY_DN25787_c0_g1_i2.p1  ORF type:complete len:1017 (-),score=204.50 TRINITY_DN25787_c0_g1_i2:70-3120(-)
MKCAKEEPDAADDACAASPVTPFASGLASRWLPSASPMARAHSHGSGNDSEVDNKSWSSKVLQQHPRLQRRLGRSRISAEQLLRQPRFIVNELRKPRSKPVSVDQVYSQEAAASDARFARIADCGFHPRPFSVAFSGGGVRAAAFHCGVIWRLAEQGRLKDVEHLSLVSGGAYVGTAFMTFVMKAIAERAPSAELSSPATGAASKSVDTSAAAASVRDEELGASPHAEQSRRLAAEEDLDYWYLGVAWQLIERMQSNAGFLVRFGRNPFKRKGARPPAQGLLHLPLILLLAFVLLPAANMMFVAVPLALLLDTEAGDYLRMYWCNSSNAFEAWTIRKLVAAACAACLALTAQLSMGALKRCIAAKGGQRTRSQTRALLLLLGVRSAALCGFAFFLAMLWFSWISLGLQLLYYVPGPGCGVFVQKLTESGLFYDGGPVNASSMEMSMPMPPRPRMTLLPLWIILSVSIIALGVLGSCLRWSILVIRRNHIAVMLSLLWTTLAGSMLIRWRVFNSYSLHFHEHWHVLMVVMLVVACCILPMYGKLRQSVHLYYRRSLRRAFYRDGEDVNLSDSSGVTLCPNVIISTTLVDYVRPECDGETPHYSEFFFTPQWMGGERTGFIEAPKELRLSRVMAVSGAASDAFLLTKMNSVWVRLALLGFFNLFMGDYIEFRTSTHQGRWTGRLQAFSVNVFFVMFYVLIFVASENELPPETMSILFYLAWGLIGLLVVASFFGGLKCFSWTLSSTIIRHLHMAMMHYHTADDPPLRLFLNDGGLVECLGLISLLRRKCEFMLVTDATADFALQLVCLRETMRIAMEERLCTFYDPEDARRGVEPMLQDFAKGNSACMRLGVLYDGWNAGGGSANGDSHSTTKTGEIFFVRMRLVRPGRLLGAPRITKNEVMGVDGDADDARQESACDGLREEEVGGCCCDCCHKFCNCGLMGRFPEIATGNQFLTPTQFSLLCRLGYEVSGEAIESLGKCQEVRQQAQGSLPPATPGWSPTDESDVDLDMSDNTVSM